MNFTKSCVYESSLTRDEAEGSLLFGFELISLAVINKILFI